MKEMVGGCCVCSDERGWDENPLVYCDGHGCNVAVHQGTASCDTAGCTERFGIVEYSIRALVHLIVVPVKITGRYRHTYVLDHTTFASFFFQFSISLRWPAVLHVSR